MVLVIFLSILLPGNASFANDFSHFNAWQANSYGSGVILMPAELPVQRPCVLCQETMGRQSASPHETQCSAAVVWLRSTGGGQGLGTAFIIPVLSPLCCLLLLHLLLLVLASEIGNPWRGEHCHCSQTDWDQGCAHQSSNKPSHRFHNHEDNTDKH